jgi:predicted short-subunit dehydrogenase-like oxidoreductase (DUF2520 family)
MSSPTIAVVGAGRTGRTLGLLARRAGYPIGPVVCRSRERAEEAVRFIGGGEAATSPRGAALTLICVPDGEIARVAAALEVPPGAAVAHVCAAYGADLLRPHRPAGALHPLRSFADPALAAERFAGTYCAVDGDAEATALLDALVLAIGGRPLRVRSEAKALYHAGAVFASNYVVAALEAAARCLGAAGVDRREAVEAAASLAGGTVENVKAVGLPAALTGPVERGDEATVRRHADALARELPGLLPAYASLGKLAVEAALAKRSIDAAEAARLEAALGR